MKLSGLLISLALCAPMPVVSEAQDSQGKALPRIEIGYQVLLSEAMNKVVQQYDSSFAVLGPDNFREDDWKSFLGHLPGAKAYQWNWQSSPSAVIGDFNGDTYLDAALLGKTSRYSRAIIAVLSKASGKYESVEIYKSTNTERMALGFAGKGTQRQSHWEQKPLKLDSDAFEVVYLEASSRIYYWQDGVLRVYQTSD